MESTNSYQVEDEVEETEKMLEQKKKEWELNHLQSLKEAEERKHAEEEDDMLFTYIRDDTYDQVNKKSSKPTKNNKNSTVRKNSSVDTKHTDRLNNSQSKNLHVNIKPFILKLGDAKIAQIKKTAHETIQAKNILVSKSPGRPPRRKLSAGVNKKTTPVMNIVTSKKTITTVSTTTTKNVGRPSRKQNLDKSALQNASDKQLPSPSTNTNNRNAVTMKDFMSSSKRLTARSAGDVNSSNGVTVSTKTSTSQKGILKNNTTLSSAASSPNSLGSPDSLSGDIRRSSRTPRPKVMNDDWVVYN